MKSRSEMKGEGAGVAYWSEEYLGGGQGVGDGEEKKAKMSALICVLGAWQTIL